VSIKGVQIAGQILGFRESALDFENLSGNGISRSWLVLDL
jgi:hypothetical protein